MNPLGVLFLALALQNEEFRKKLQETYGDVQKTTDASQNKFGQMAGSLQAVGKAAGALGASLGLLAFGQQAMKAAEEVENFRKALESMNGATEETAKLWEDLQQIARESPFQTGDIATAAQRMLELGASAETTEKTIAALVDTAAALKKSPEFIEATAAAFARMEAQGQATTKTMQQLVNEGIPAWQMLAKTLGTTVSEAMERVKAGAVDAKTAIGAVTEGMAERYKGAAENATKTWAGTWGQLKKTAGDAMEEIGKSIISFLDKAAVLMQPMIFSLQKVAEYWKGLPEPIRDAAVAAGAAAAGALALAGGLASLVLAVKGVIAGFGLLAAALSIASGPLLAIIAGVAAAVAALTLLANWVQKNWEPIKRVFTTGWEGISELWTAAWDKIHKALSDKWAEIQKSADDYWKNFVKVLTDPWDLVVKFFTDAWNRITQALTNAWQDLSKAADSFWKPIVTFFIGIWQPVATAFTTVWTGITNFLNQVWTNIVNTVSSIFGDVKKWIDDFLKRLASLPGVDKLLNLDKVWADGQKAAESMRQVAEQQKKAAEAAEAQRKANEEAAKAQAKAIEEYERNAKVLGVDTTAALKRALDERKAAYENMRKSGMATEQDLAAAALAVKKAEEDLAGGSKNLREERQKNADAAKKSAEETMKNWEELKKAEKGLADSSFQLSTSFAKAYNDMAAESKKTVDIVIKEMDRLPPEVQKALVEQGKLAVAFKNLGLESERALQAAAQAAEQNLSRIEAAYRRGAASAKDVADAEKKLQDIYDQLAKHLDPSIDAMEKLGAVTTATLERNVADAQRWYDAVVQGFEAGTRSAEDMRQAFLRLEAAQKSLADNAEGELVDAYKQLGMTSAEELQDLAYKNEKAAEKIADDTGRGSYKAMEAEVAALKARKEAIQAYGGDLTKEQQKRLDQLEEKLKEHSKRTRTIWQEWFGEVTRMWQDFAQNVLQRLFYGSEQNKQLDQQAADLRASLAEREQDYQDSIAAIEADQQGAYENYLADLDAATAAHNKALAERQSDYDEYAAEVATNIDKIQQKHADAVAKEVDDLQDALADKQQDYEEYAKDVAENIEEIREKWEDNLRKETEKLRDELRDRTQAYQDFVEDSNKTLSRLGEETATNIADETADTQSNIDERTRDYQRYVEDTQKKIRQVREKNKGVYSEEEADLEQSIRRKKEDLDFYISEQNRKLDEYVRDQKKRQSQEEEDLQTSYDRRTRDFNEYLDSNKKAQDDAYTKYEEGQAKEIGAQQDALQKKRNDLDEFASDTQEKIDETTAKHKAAQDQEVADQVEALNKKRTELDAFFAEEQEKYENQQNDINATYEATTTKLTEELAKQTSAWETYKQDAIGKLEEIKAAHTSFWEDIGKGAISVFESMGMALASLVTDKLVGMLFKELGKLVDNILPGVSGAFGKVFGGGSSGGGGIPGLGGGGGGGGAAAGAAGGFSGAFNMITGGISAIAGVASFFQGMQQEKGINAIEHNTLYSMMYLGERSDGGILGRLFDIADKTQWLPGQLDRMIEMTGPMMDNSNLAILKFDDIIRNTNKLNEYADAYGRMVTSLENISWYTEAYLPQISNAVNSIQQNRQQTPTALNVTVTATGVTTKEAAKVMGDQIATNLTGQLTPVY